MFFKIGVLENFAIFTGKYLCWSLLLIKLQVFKKRLQHRCIPVNIAKFLRATFSDVSKTHQANKGHRTSGEDSQIFKRIVGGEEGGGGGGGVLYVGHHGWPANKILGFRWSKEAEITLETISFWQDTVNEKRKTEKCWTLFYNRPFYKAL